MPGRIIETEADLAEGADWLRRRDGRFAQALDLTGPLRLRRRESGFSTLLGAIVSQQVSVASADAVWRRLEAAGHLNPSSIARAGDDDLRACGLSRQKARYARALATSGIEFDTLTHLPDGEVIRRLTAVTGIGIWTAEVYVMFALGRADVFAAGDLAIQESARVLFELPERPGEKLLRKMAVDWSPWRTVAACVFWQYYRVIKDREGIRT